MCFIQILFMHNNAHVPHNGELKHALAYLKGINQIKENRDVAKKLKVSEAYLSRCVNGVDRPSPTFIDKFEKTFLKPLQLTLSNFEKPLLIDIKKALEQPESETEHIINRLALIEAMLQVSFDLYAKQHGKTEEEQEKIRSQIDERVLVEVSSTQALIKRRKVS